MADTDLSPGMNAPNLWQPKEEEGEERAPPQINFAKEEEEEAQTVRRQLFVRGRKWVLEEEKMVRGDTEEEDGGGRGANLRNVLTAC